MREFATLDTPTVAAVLTDAPSIRNAVYRLRTSESRLRKVCRSNPELRPLYAKVVSRGIAKSTAARRLFRYGV